MRKNLFWKIILLIFVFIFLPQNVFSDFTIDDFERNDENLEGSVASSGAVWGCDHTAANCQVIDRKAGIGVDTGDSSNQYAELNLTSPLQNENDWLRVTWDQVNSGGAHVFLELMEEEVSVLRLGWDGSGTNTCIGNSTFPCNAENKFFDASGDPPPTQVVTVYIDPVNDDFNVEFAELPSGTPANYTLINSRTAYQKITGFRLSSVAIDGGSIQHFDNISTNVEPDTTPPSITSTSINNTQPVFDDSVGISAEVSDGRELDSIFYANNLSGSLSNVSSINLSSGQTLVNYSVNITNSFTKGNVVGHIFTTNDTSGNSVQSSLLTYEVTNKPPFNGTINSPAPNTLYPSDGISLNITIPDDADGDAITEISWYINGTLNQSTAGNTTLNASDGEYNLSVSVFDGTDWSENSTITSFKIDTVDPTDDLLTQIPDATYINEDTNFTITATDDNLFGHNVTVYNASGQIQFSGEVLDITGTSNSIVIQANISWGDGNYTPESNESDDHTAKEIPDWGKIKDDTAQIYGFDTGAVETKVKFVSCDFPLQKYEAIKELDRYREKFTLAGAKVKGKVNTCAFDVISNRQIYYRQDSGYPAHFVMGDVWRDFVLNTEEDVAHSVAPNGDGSYRVTIETTETVLEFQSVGGVNKGSSQTHLIIDTADPGFKSNSTSSSSPEVDSSVTLTVGANDTWGIGTVKVEIVDPNDARTNFTMTLNEGAAADGNWTKAYTPTLEGQHTLTYYLVDLAGNEINSGTTDSFTAVAASEEGGSSGGGGGGGSSGISSSAVCSLELTRPQEGGLISMYVLVGDQSNEREFSIKNVGNKVGQYSFSIQDNDFLQENCQFREESIEIEPGLTGTNGITCTVKEETQEAVIKVSGCGLEKNLRLSVTASPFRALFDSALSGDQVNIFGKLFSPLAFWGGVVGFVVFILPLLALFLIFLWRKIRGG